MNKRNETVAIKREKWLFNTFYENNEISDHHFTQELEQKSSPNI